MSQETGFSIIEVLVVSAIFGILALIALPQYSSYQQRGYNAIAAKDLRDVAAAQESYFGKHGAYQPISHCGTPNVATRCEITNLPGISSLSRGVALSIAPLPNGFKGTARHVNGNTICRWDSTQGGLQGCSKDSAS